MTTCFDSVNLGGLALKSRVIRSATAERFSMDGDDDGRQVGALYTALVQGGVGCVITGHCTVLQSGRAYPRMAGFYTDMQLAQWRRVVAQVHSAGGVIVAQLNHGGGRCMPESAGTPVCVSVLPDRPKDPMTGVVLDDTMIAAIIAAFGAAAAHAKALGMDGVQIHAAHGYLGSQFLSPLTNRRTDPWGGSLENRARFLRGVVRAVRQAVGPAYPVGMKLGVLDDPPEGLTVADALQAAQWFQADGVRFIEISGAFHSDVCKRKIKPESEGYYVPLARQFKAGLSVPVVAVGGFRSVESMNRALAEGACDAVSLARPFVREPDVLVRLKRGAVSACISCNLCLLKHDQPTKCHAALRVKTV